MARSEDESLISFFEKKIKTNTDECVLAGIFLALTMLGEEQYTEPFMALLNDETCKAVCYVANSVCFDIESTPFIKQCLEEKQKDSTNSIAVNEAINNALNRIKEDEVNEI